MAALDIIVLFLLGSGAIFGFLRGFVQEAFSLIAWVLIIAAIRILHAPVAGWLTEPIGPSRTGWMFHVKQRFLSPQTASEKGLAGVWMGSERGLARCRAASKPVRSKVKDQV